MINPITKITEITVGEIIKQNSEKKEKTTKTSMYAISTLPVHLQKGKMSE